MDRIEQSFSGADEAEALGLARNIAQASPTQPNKSLYLIDDSTRVEWETDPEAIRAAGRELAGLYKSGITHFNLGYVRANGIMRSSASIADKRW